MEGKKFEVKGSKLMTIVVSSAIIGSAKNSDFLMGLLQTQAGQFQVNNNESPEAVDLVAKLREGDAIEVEMFEPFKPSSYINNAGDTIHGASCQRFKILSVDGGEETVVTGLEKRQAKKPIIGKKPTTPGAGGEALSESSESEEDRG